MEPSKEDPKKALFQIASQQGGYFTTQQAGEAGYYTRLRHYHLHSGNWERVGRGVYRLAGYPLDRWDDWIRWSFWSCSRKGEIQAVISHESAALYHELADYLPVKTHLTVPPGFRRKAPSACILHKRRLPVEAVEDLGGFRVTTPYRTLQDLKQDHGEPDQWAQALEEAAKRGLITIKQKEALSR